MALIVYLVAFLEWFTTLSVEIVALRQFTPIIGSSSISTSIILWVILLALSYWYYRWWVLAERWIDIERKLITNLILSSLYYFFISFIFYWVFLEWFLGLIWSYSLAILLTSFFLFFIPVFFASQTIPLLSVLLKWKSNGVNIGKLLFYSTVGSFAWSVGTSTILFSLVWVSKTAIISPILLSICSLLVIVFFYKQKSKILLYISGSILAIYLLAFTIDLPAWPNTLYETANAHHNIRIADDTLYNERVFFQNGAYSSGIDIDTKDSFFEYIIEARKKVEELKPKTVLVIWAAGFTFPREVAQYDFVESIDVVDVDWDLKDIAEKYFLQEKLSDKIIFYGQPSRYFLSSTEKKYDFIFIDVYSWKSLPSQVLTKEFFSKLDSIWTSVYLNLILDQQLMSDFSQNLFTTLNHSFGKTYYKDMSETSRNFTNFLASNIVSEWYIENTETSGSIYTDDKHSIEQDKFKLDQFRK